jgi:hypothetical protein
VKVPTQTAETQPELLVTKVTDMHGITLRSHAADLRTTDRGEQVARDGEQASVAAFNASL